MTVARRRPDRQRASGLSAGLAAVAIALAGIAAYANSFNGVFVFDDRTAIVLNPAVKTPWPLSSAMSAPRDTALAGRPIASLSFALTYALAPADSRDVFTAGPGTDAALVDRFERNLWTYHAVNLGIHLLAALTLFGVVRRTLRTRIGTGADIVALATATVWVVHPLTTSAVTYIVQRAESLMALFYLLTLYCAIRADEPSNTRVWAAAAIAACALGMGTKETFVTAPVMVMAWDFLMLDAPWRETLRRRWSLYLGLGTTWAVLAAIMVSSPRAGSVGFGLEGVSAWAYLRTQAGVIAHYLRLAFVPWPLALDYEWPIATSLADVVVPGIVVLALLGATIWGVVRRAAWSFAGVWFFLILAPTSSIVPIVTEVAADHRMYLPLAGIAASIVLLMVRQLPKAAVIAATIATVVGLVTVTGARNDDYASQERLYAATVAVRPSNARARSNLAAVLIEQGRGAEAEPQLREAMRLRPDFPDPYANLAVAYVTQGRLQESLPLFERAVQLAPASVQVWRNYGEALGGVGRFADAVRAFRKVLPSSPDDPDLLEGLAWILATAQDAGVRDAKSALDLAQHAAAVSNERAPNIMDTLAAAYAESGRFTEAVTTAEKALALARDARRVDLIPQIEMRLELYRTGQPYREPPRP